MYKNTLFPLNVRQDSLFFGTIEINLARFPFSFVVFFLFVLFLLLLLLTVLNIICRLCVNLVLNIICLLRCVIGIFCTEVFKHLLSPDKKSTKTKAPARQEALHMLE